MAEAFIVASLLEMGKAVLKPVGDNLPYDVVFEDRGTFFRVQCKTAAWGDERQTSLYFMSSSRNSVRGYDRRGYRGLADYFGVYFPPLRKVYLIPVDDCPQREVWMRLAPTRNNQVARTRNAADFEIERVLSPDDRRPHATWVCT